LRRTTSHDIVRPDGVLGRVVVHARGRDLHTASDGSSSVLDEARLVFEVGHPDDRVVTAVTSTPTDDRLEALVGNPYDRGFRRNIGAALAGGASSLLHQVLDDVPVVLLLGEGVVHLAWHADPTALPKPSMAPAPDVCAAWAVGGTIRVETHDDLGPVPTGPAAPDLTSASDPHAWHDIGTLPPSSNRRQRRTDVWADGQLVMVESHFRDVHADAVGEQMVLHEYTVRASIDPAASTIASCTTEVGVLPWQECPGAAASAGRIEGLPIDGLAEWVRTSMRGPSTCTHLNDTLRGLEGVGPLVTALRP
jgi:hypothetical protein